MQTNFVNGLLEKLFGGGARKLATRPTDVCPACGSPRIEPVGRHEYKATFHRWGMVYKDVLERIPEVARAPQIFDLFRCEDCALVFTDSYPGETVTHVEASRSYEEEIIAPYLATMQPVVDDALMRRLGESPTPDSQEVHWAAILRILRETLADVPRPRVAEIGSCYGAFAEIMARSLTPEVFLACETNGKFLAELKRRYPHLQATRRPVEAWKERDFFDLVYCSDVIEHVWDFRGFLKTVAGRLAAGGKLVVVTPNIECDASVKEGLAWWGYLIPHHCQLFSARALEAACASAGFELVEARNSFQELVGVYRKKTVAY